MCYGYYQFLIMLRISFPVVITGHAFPPNAGVVFPAFSRHVTRHAHLCTQFPNQVYSI